MAKNVLQSEANVIKHTLTGTVASGAPLLLTNTVGIALSSGVSGDVVAIALEGIFTVAKMTGSAWTVGQKLSWRPSQSAFTAATPTTGDVVGVAVAVAAAASGDTSGVVKLTPGNTTIT